MVSLINVEHKEKYLEVENLIHDLLDKMFDLAIPINSGFESELRSMLNQTADLMFEERVKFDKQLLQNTQDLHDKQVMKEIAIQIKKHKNERNKKH